MDERTMMRRLDKLLDEVLDLPSQKQAPFLEELARKEPEIARRLGHLLGIRDEADSFLEGTLSLLAEKTEPMTGPTAPHLKSQNEKDLAGHVIGPWKLLKKIGHGGMGRVYLAMRTDGQFDRQVAFKLLKYEEEDPYLQARFYQERAVLASLRHPNISQLLDSGVTAEGWPYYIMEHIEGITFLDYCERHRLDVHERLELFLEVCDAVQYAHRNMVIHRDIKASNILVTEEGHVKLLDFGIAKVLHPEESGVSTGSTLGGRFFTPECAAPEQIKGLTITTATDVYALGALLYRLLAGKSHIRLGGRGGHQAILLALFDTRPRPPSARLQEEPEASEKIATQRATTLTKLSRRLRGDLDAIVLKCLEHDPKRRYQDVATLAIDIRNHLTYLPVYARGRGALYRAGLFVRRHIPGMLAAALVILVIGLSALQQKFNAARLLQERNEAHREMSETRQAIELFKEIYASSRVERPDEVEASLGLLRQGAEEVRDGLGGNEQTRADLLEITADHMEGLGALNDARAVMEQALAFRARTHTPDSLPFARTAARLAHLKWRLGEVNAAYKDLETSWPVFEAALPESHPFWLDLRLDMAEILVHLGQRPRAEVHLKKALAQADLHPQKRDVIGRIHLLLARLYAEDGQAVAAVKHGRSAVKHLTTVLGEGHPVVGEALNVLGGYLATFEGPDTARPVLERALQVLSQRHGETHSCLVPVLDNLAEVARKEEAASEEYRLRERAYRILLQTGLGGKGLAHVKTRLAAAAIRVGDYKRAETLLLESRTILHKLVGPDDPENRYHEKQLGYLYRAMDQPEKAMEWFTAALQRHPEDGGASERASAARLWILRGESLARQDQWDRAIKEMNHGLALGEGSDPSLEAYAQLQLGTVYFRQGQHQRALDLLERAYRERPRLGKDEQRELLLQLKEVSRQVQDEARERKYSQALRSYDPEKP